MATRRPCKKVLSTGVVERSDTCPATTMDEHRNAADTPTSKHNRTERKILEMPAKKTSLTPVLQQLESQTIATTTNNGIMQGGTLPAEDKPAVLTEIETENSSATLSRNSPVAQEEWLRPCVAKPLEAVSTEQSDAAAQLPDAYTIPSDVPTQKLDHVDPVQQQWPDSGTADALVTLQRDEATHLSDRYCCGWSVASNNAPIVSEHASYPSEGISSTTTISVQFACDMVGPQVQPNMVVNDESDMQVDVHQEECASGSPGVGWWWQIVLPKPDTGTGFGEVEMETDMEYQEVPLVSHKASDKSTTADVETSTNQAVADKACQGHPSADDQPHTEDTDVRSAGEHQHSSEQSSTGRSSGNDLHRRTADVHDAGLAGEHLGTSEQPPTDIDTARHTGSEPREHPSSKQCSCCDKKIMQSACKDDSTSSCSPCSWYNDFVSSLDDCTYCDGGSSSQKQQQSKVVISDKIQIKEVKSSEATSKPIDISQLDNEMKTFACETMDKKCATDIPGIEQTNMDKLREQDMQTAERILGRYLLLKRDQKKMGEVLVNEGGLDQSGASKAVLALEAWCCHYI